MRRSKPLYARTSADMWTFSDVSSDKRQFSQSIIAPGKHSSEFLVPQTLLFQLSWAGQLTFPSGPRQPQYWIVPIQGPKSNAGLPSKRKKWTSMHQEMCTPWPGSFERSISFLFCTNRFHRSCSRSILAAPSLPKLLGRYHLEELGMGFCGIWQDGTRFFTRQAR